MKKLLHKAAFGLALITTTLYAQLKPDSEDASVPSFNFVLIAAVEVYPCDIKGKLSDKLK